MSRALTFRPATTADLDACGEIWRDSINDYRRGLGMSEFPPEFASIRRLHAHTLATDPDRFLVVVRAGGPNVESGVESGVGPGVERPVGRGLEAGERPVAFVSAVVRGPLWFLSMLFVRPEEQGAGIGRALLDQVLPATASDAAHETATTAATTLATCTDSAQPVSNGLYASLGIVPRMPLYDVIGYPRPDAFPALPAGIVVSALDGDGSDREIREIREIAGELGIDHRQDHDFLRTEDRRGFLYRDGGGRTAAFGYASPVGRLGPIGVRDPDLMAAVLGHLVRAVVPRGPFAMWVPGAADRAFVGLLRAGLRLDGLPVLMCWSRPFADFSRYVPISPGLL
ncbi:MAG TPA: GNAT family N-acetyltransferase [Candidatus Limnocylindrales bacterium]